MEQEDYLETIYELKKEFGHVRISDIAKKLNLRKPSVTQMMQRLDKDGCVVYRPYLPLKLTKKGEKIGKDIGEKRRVLEEFFSLLKISNKIREENIHGIEHSMNKITLTRIKKVIKFLKHKKF
ncbi:transcriptional regulator MntR, partial [Candidatus Peregrinibacteria bacterium]|nr:transcriptional regulator MntR [Candidatus Peregrinibacteria bacterium]